MEPTPSEAADKGFRAYPKNRLVAILDTRDAVEAALAELRAAGAPEGSIEVFYGEAGARVADMSGERHGLLARLIRKVQSIGELAEYKARYEEAVGSGRYVLAMDAEAEALRAKAVDILKGQKAYCINFFGPFTVQKLAP